MKKMLLILAAGLAALPCFAQTVTVSASKLADGGSLANGTIYFQPVLQNGQRASYHRPGGGIATITAMHATVAGGAFSLTMPDTTLTNPVNICFAVTLNTSNGSVLGPGYTCAQPHATATGIDDWCQASVCNFDNYVPDLPPLIPATAGPTGAPGPNCAVGSPPGTCDMQGANITGAGSIAAGATCPLGAPTGSVCAVKQYGDGSSLTNLPPAAWGAVVGSIGSQADLQTALAAKAAVAASTTVNGVTCTLGSTCTVTATPLVPMGTYNAGTTYVAGNLVYSAGSDYICITGCTGVTPANGATWMLLMAAPIAPCTVRTVTATDTATTADCLIRASGTFTETLPASPVAGEAITVKNISTGTITVAGNGHLIDTASTYPLATSFGYQPTVTLQWDSASTTWNIR